MSDWGALRGAEWGACGSGGQDTDRQNLTPRLGEHERNRVMKPARFLPILAAATVLLEWHVMAADLVQMESRHLGDGLFEYAIEFPDGRYFDKVDFDAFDLGLPNLVESFVETPEHWAGASRGWRHDPMIWEAVPYRCTFRIQSGMNAHRQATMTIVWAQHWHSWAVPDGTSNNEETPPRMWAYGNLIGLVPCALAESDDSPAEYVSSVPGYPEVKVESVVMSKGKPTGIGFQVGRGLPVVVEASDDLKTWVVVGSAVGASGVTTWTSDDPLHGMGRFFRVAVNRQCGAR